MSMVLNEEQTILKHSAHEFFSAQMPVKNLRALRDRDDPSGIDRAAWAAMAELGWTGILVPEQFGGAAFGYVGCGQILEAAGRTLAASPLVSSALIGAPLVAAAGSLAQKEAILPPLVAGECVLALALEESSRHAPSTLKCRAEATANGYVISGKKQFVLDGHIADYFVVATRTSGESDDTSGITLFLIAATTPGVRVTRTRMVDSRNAAIVEFTDTAVDQHAVLGEVGKGFLVLEPILDGARAGLAAEMLGCGLEAFERTLAYLKMREQFDVPIGSFQALKHRAALMFCEIELTKSAVLAALNALDGAAPERAELASLAKAKAGDMLELVSCEAVQMHGGIGMTDAEDIGLFLKRARVAEQTFGDASFHRQRYATLLGF